MNPRANANISLAGCSTLAELVAEHASASDELSTRAETLLAPLAKAGLVVDLTARFRKAQNGAVIVQVEISRRGEKM